MAAGTRSRWPRCHDRAVRVDLQTDAGRAKVGWRHVFVSAVVAAVLFELGKTDWPVSRQKRIGQFLCRNRRAGLSLAWVYYAVQILLLGASSPESMSMPMALRGMGPSQHWCSWVPTRSQLLYRRQLQHHPHPAEVTVATVARWRRLAARELPPKITAAGRLGPLAHHRGIWNEARAASGARGASLKPDKRLDRVVPRTWRFFLRSRSAVNPPRLS